MLFFFKTVSFMHLIRVMVFMTFVLMTHGDYVVNGTSRACNHRGVQKTDGRCQCREVRGGEHFSSDDNCAGSCQPGWFPSLEEFLEIAENPVLASLVDNSVPVPCSIFCDQERGTFKLSLANLNKRSCDCHSTRYTGEHCTECAVGRIGRDCTITQIDCGEHGSAQFNESDAEVYQWCECDDKTTGARCSKCKKEYFHWQRDPDICQRKWIQTCPVGSYPAWNPHTNVQLCVCESGRIPDTHSLTGANSCFKCGGVHSYCADWVHSIDKENDAHTEVGFDRIHRIVESNSKLRSVVGAVGPLYTVRDRRAFSESSGADLLEENTNDDDAAGHHSCSPNTNPVGVAMGDCSRCAFGFAGADCSLNCNDPLNAESTLCVRVYETWIEIDEGIIKTLSESKPIPTTTLVFLIVSGALSGLCVVVLAFYFKPSGALNVK